MIYKNIGYDNDGDRIDVVLSFVRVEMQHRKAAEDTLIVGCNRDLVKDTAWLGIGANNGQGIDADIQLNIYKTGTKTPAAGAFLMGLTDIDQPGYSTGSLNWNDPYSERIEFVSGFAETFYVPQDNFLKIEKGRGGDNTLFRATKEDGGTYNSGVVAQLYSGAVIHACGSDAWTDLFTQFESHNIVASAGEGGKISPKGNVNAGWKTTKIFTARADAWHTIKSISIDGKEIEIPHGQRETTYTFSSVVADHTIHVEFETYPVSVVWIDALTGAEVATYNLNSGEDSLIPDFPEHMGHIFTHLSGDSWHRIAEDAVIYINYSPYAYDFPQDSSARYNGFTFAYEGK